MKLSSFVLSSAVIVSATLSSLSAQALPMASPVDHFNAATQIEKVYGGCGPYGHRGPWGRCRPGGQWAGGYMAGAHDPMPIDPIMPRSIIRFGGMVQPIGKQDCEFWS